MENGKGELLPVIDFEDFPKESTKLIKACEEWGCFRLINFHKILPTSLMADMKGVVRSLLDLPLEIKKCIKSDERYPSTGYFSSSPQNPIGEALSITEMNRVEQIDSFCSQLNASPYQRETVKKYAAAIHELSMDIAQKICEGLNIKNVSFEGWPFQFRFNKYNFTEENIGSTGVVCHSDPFFLNIVQDDEDVGGLEVMKKSGEFVAAEPCPNSILVNMGDITNAWSNGRFCNVKHRVLCKEGKTRMSIVTMMDGPSDTKVEAPQGLIDDEHPRLYLPFTLYELLKKRISIHKFEGEVLDHFKVV